MSDATRRVWICCGTAWLIATQFLAVDLAKHFERSEPIRKQSAGPIVEIPTALPGGAIAEKL